MSNKFIFIIQSGNGFFLGLGIYFITLCIISFLFRYENLLYLIFSSFLF